MEDGHPAYGAWVEPPLFDGAGEHLECFSTASELRQALLRSLAELEAVRAAHQAELRRVESEAAQLVAFAAAERDELRRHCQSLLLLLTHTPSTDPPLNAMDEAEESELARRLPEKGRLVEAVVSAGPLLQTLLLAGPLPQWRHPPPPAMADVVIPPFRSGADYSSSSSPESNCSGAPVAAVAQLPCFHINSFCI